VEKVEKVEKVETAAADLGKVEMPVAEKQETYNLKEKEQIKKAETVPAEKQEAYSLTEVENFIYSWKDAWEKEDLTRYILCYDKGFKSRGMDLAAWEEHREDLNEKYSSLTIEINDLKIKRISDNSAKVTFTQNYRADSYKDAGNKELVLIKTDKDWKIKEEEWTPIKKK